MRNLEQLNSDINTRTKIDLSSTWSKSSVKQPHKTILNFVKDDILFIGVGRGYWKDFPRQPVGFDIFKIEDIENPELIDTFDFTENCLSSDHYVYDGKDYIITSSVQEGLRIFEFSYNETLSQYKLIEKQHFQLKFMGNVIGAFGGLKAFQQEQAGSLKQFIAVGIKRATLTGDQEELLKIYDISDPENPPADIKEILTKFPVTMQHYTYEGKSYLAVTGEELAVIKLNDLTDAEKGGSWTLPCIDVEVFFKDGIPHAASPTLNFMGVLNLQDPDSLQFVINIMVDQNTNDIIYYTSGMNQYIVALMYNQTTIYDVNQIQEYEKMETIDSASTALDEYSLYMFGSVMHFEFQAKEYIYTTGLEKLEILQVNYECNTGYYKQGYSQCNECMGLCLQCDNAETCINCKDINREGDLCTCKQGFYIPQGSPQDGECIQCESPGNCGQTTGPPTNQTQPNPNPLNTTTPPDQSNNKEKKGSTVIMVVAICVGVVFFVALDIGLYVLYKKRKLELIQVEKLGQQDIVIENNQQNQNQNSDSKDNNNNDDGDNNSSGANNDQTSGASHLNQQNSLPAQNALDNSLNNSIINSSTNILNLQSPQNFKDTQDSLFQNNNNNGNNKNLIKDGLIPVQEELPKIKKPNLNKVQLAPLDTTYIQKQQSLMMKNKMQNKQALQKLYTYDQENPRKIPTKNQQQISNKSNQF